MTSTVLTEGSPMQRTDQFRPEPQVDVGIVSNNERLRWLIRRGLSGDLYRLRTFDSARQFLAAEAAYDSSSAFVDLEGNGEQALQFLETLSCQNLTLSIVFVGKSSFSPTQIVQMMRSGASNVMTGIPEPDLVRQVTREATALNAFRREWLEQTVAARKICDQLSARQFEILECLAQGLPNKSIAAKLFLSTRTVEKHRSLLCKRTGMHNIIDLLKLHQEATRPFSDMYSFVCTKGTAVASPVRKPGALLSTENASSPHTC